MGCAVQIKVDIWLGRYARHSAWLLFCFGMEGKRKKAGIRMFLAGLVDRTSQAYLLCIYLHSFLFITMY